MSPKVLLRLTSGLLVIFAIGHTAGFLTFHPTEPSAAAVLQSMKTVPFDFFGSTRNWFDLYIGFGLVVSISLFIAASTAWRLSSCTAAQAPLASSVAWLMSAAQAGNFVVSVVCFAVLQVGFTLASALMLAWCAVRLASERERASASR